MFLKKSQFGGVFSLMLSNDENQIRHFWEEFEREILYLHHPIMTYMILNFPIIGIVREGSWQLFQIFSQCGCPSMLYNAKYFMRKYFEM